MNNSDFIFAIVVGLILWSVIIYNLISYASRSKKIENHLWRQTNLLSKIAKANGVDKEEIDKILHKPLP